MTGLILDFWTELKNIVSGFFAIIPQIIYFLYTSMACLLDFGQLVLRKLIGLDVYYLKDADTGDYLAQSGDILKEFIEGILGIKGSYSAFNTVFWSLIIFGAIVLVLTTIISIIKSHYNYDSEKSNPMKIIKSSIKSLALMAITPLVVLFGVYLSEVILQSLDQITTSSYNSNINSVFESEAIGKIKKITVDRNGNSVGTESGEDYVTYYNSFDIYGVTEWTNTATFSGKIFELITQDANRVRIGDYTPTQTVSNTYWDNCGIFYSSDEGDIKNKVADQIDFAFKNSLTLMNPDSISISGSESKKIIGYTLSYGPSAAFELGLINVTHFSKFNVGLVWYYYNLWTVNYILGFAAVIACGILMTGIIFGLIKRLIICTVLFLIQAPIIGISPLDGGNGFREWKNKFMSYFIAGYGAVAGMNLFFLILPVLEGISFFNITILDRLFDMIIIIAGLTMVSKMVTLISGFIGGADLQKEGQELKQGVIDTSVSAAMKTIQTASLGVKAGRFAVTGGMNGAILRKFNGEKAFAPFSETRKIKPKKEKKREGSKRKALKSGIVKSFNSTANRVILSYLGLNHGKLTNGDWLYRKQLIEEASTDEHGNKVALTDEQLEQIDRMVEAHRQQGNRDLANEVKFNLQKLGGGLLDSLSESTMLKSAIEKMVAAGIGDELKGAAQTVMKTFNMDTSAIESGDINSAGGYSLFITKKQAEKHSKEVEKAKEKNLTEASDNINKTTGDIVKLVEVIKRMM